MKMRSSTGLIAVLFILPAILFFNSCSRNNKAADSQTVFSARLVKPVDATDLEKRLKAELVRRYERMYTGYMYYADFMTGGPGGGAGTGTDGMGADSTTATAVSDSTGSGASGSIAYSETNNQEQGVDEGDVVKTDGEYIYLARGSRFMILKAAPPEEMSIVSNIDLKQPISELHLSGSLVTLVSNTYSYEAKTATGGCSPMRSAYFTHVSLYDVANHDAPTLTANFVFPGAAQGSRRIDDTVYFIINHSIELATPAAPWQYLTYPYDQNAYKQAVDKALAENRKKIEALTLDDLLPSYTRTSGSPYTGPVVNYKDVYIPEFGNGTDISIVVSLDISKRDPSPVSSGVLTSWCKIYMNRESLYLASDNNWRWIEPLSDAEAPQQNPEPRTAVHKFNLENANGAPVYRGSGIVDGWVSDRFSMSDYQGYLRIGTTRGGWWGESISNQLAIMEENDGNLVEKGKITGLAPSERIYSMRFDRDRGYMVTFRQTDPLFTLDLSDPKNPRVAGEIKVDGFATYIHLIGGDNRQLLTIGRSADSTGRVTGNKLQLFSVEDLSAPTLIDSYELGSGWSSAIYDPHAFLYYGGVLTIPYSSSSYDAGHYTYSSGLRVFDIGTASITPHGSGIISAQTVSTAYGSYYDTVDRAVIIEDNIYAVARRTVTVAGADQLDVKRVVELPAGNLYYYYYPTGGGGISLDVAGVEPAGPMVITSTSGTTAEK